MKQTKFAITAGILAASVLLWTACSTGSGSGDTSGKTDPATTPTNPTDPTTPSSPSSPGTTTAKVPTVSDLAGTWTGTASDTTSEGGISTYTWTYTFNADSTYSELVIYKEDNPGTASDLAETEAYKGSMAVASDGVLTLTATQYYANTTQAITDISTITSWSTPSPAMKQLSNTALIDGKFYMDIYFRAGTGSGLAGTWNKSETDYEGKVSTSEFVFTDSTWAETRTENGADGKSSNGTYTISDGKMHVIQNEKEVFVAEYIVTDKYWGQDKSRAFTKKS